MLVYRCLQRVTPLRRLAQATSPLRRIGCVTAICATQPRLKTSERTSGWVVGDFLPLSPSSSPRLTLLLHPRFAHSFPCSSFRFPLNLAVKSGKHYIRFQRCPAKKMTAMVTKVGRDQIHSVPVISPPPESWRGRVPWVPWGGCVYDDGGRVQNESIVPVAAATAAGVCCAILPCYTMKRVSSYSIS